MPDTWKDANADQPPTDSELTARERAAILRQLALPVAKESAAAEFDWRSRGRRQRNVEIHVTEAELVHIVEIAAAAAIESYIRNHTTRATAPEMLAALHLIHANAAESPEWIRERLAPVIAKAEGRS